ncbi:MULTISPECIES: hypothetical protein [unclassified Rhizobium]|uniref:hypothetical protein n=1 Tax=unclassified Rhizobium TaxID=2613769 RepID=UPI0021689A87|nr:MULTISPECIES: hypothetical protein [unclassified Rhizobium]MCS3742601.1 hypothetical protein [Rhizobium sp. BK661]MCS4094567.1 hypothetical protein [Rhizobium sp. BK176]
MNAKPEFDPMAVFDLTDKVGRAIKAAKTGSPGGHPSGRNRNWKRAENFEEYIANLEAGLEPYSERRLAGHLGVSRVWIWRAKQIASIPPKLQEFLMDKGFGPRRMVDAAQALNGGRLGEISRCPHCGGIIRRRIRLDPDLAGEIVAFGREHLGWQPDES